MSKHYNIKGSALCGAAKARWDEWTPDRAHVTCPYCAGLLDSGILADVLEKPPEINPEKRPLNSSGPEALAPDTQESR